ncbi:MAG TPA: hypothetical protein VFE62_20260 [Gemmataceae bacterium]|nr:hypothetical protein [Gemmataceae bacterium]
MKEKVMNGPNRPQHRPETFFDGELQCFTDAVRLDPEDPTVKARVRKGRPSDDGQTGSEQIEKARDQGSTNPNP